MWNLLHKMNMDTCEGNLECGVLLQDKKRQKIKMRILLVTSFHSSYLRYQIYEYIEYMLYSIIKNIDASLFEIKCSIY